MKPILRIPALMVTLWVIGVASLAAQSNDRIDELLLQAKARLDSTTYIVLTAGGLIEESATPAQALEKARSLDMIGPDLTAESPVPVQDLSFLLMKSIGLPGGLYGFSPENTRTLITRSRERAVMSSTNPSRDGMHL